METPDSVFGKRVQVESLAAFKEKGTADLLKGYQPAPPDWPAFSLWQNPCHAPLPGAPALPPPWRRYANSVNVNTNFI